MNTFKIDKNIPVPMKAGETGLTATLRKLAVGDSFVASMSQRAHVTQRAQNIGIRVATRKVDESSVRVWRIE